MPLSDNVDHARRLRSVNGQYEKRVAVGNGKGGRDKGVKGSGCGPGRRVGVALDLHDTSPSLLSPLISHFSSFSGMSSLKGFLPATPVKPSNAVAETSKTGAKATEAIWQEGDLQDGRGVVPLLLVTSQSHALQIFTFPSNTIPDDPHVPETFPSPEEVCSIPQIRYDGKTEESSLPGAMPLGDAQGQEYVLCAVLLKKGNGANVSGPLIAFTTLRPMSRKATSLGPLALVIVNLQTGIAIKRVSLGMGTAAQVFPSSRVIAVTISHPTPSIHLFDPISFAPFMPALTELPANPNTSLPIISISGRLLAYTTSEAPHAPGPEGLGSIVTASSLRAAHHRSSSSTSRSTERRSSSHEQTQAVILSSAVEIGGGVARGVWAGIKMGAQAAGRARNSRLARSAPADSSSGGFADGEDDEVAESESRSLDDSSVFDESVPAPAPGGTWIKVVDLSFALQSPDSLGSTARHFIHSTPIIETIAHFRLPTSSSTLPLDTAQSMKSSTRRPSDSIYPVTHLSFSPTGTRLFAAPYDGKSFHILDIRPAGVLKTRIRSECKGEVWHQYELRRGHSASTVSSVSWDKSGRWIGVGTDRGTIHVFPVCPDGGKASAESHASIKVVNPQQLLGLSSVVLPLVRLRPARAAINGQTSPDTTGHAAAAHTGATFGFLKLRRHSVQQEQYCQDIGIYRSPSTFELTRLSVHAVKRVEKPATSGNSLQSRGSALTEMMRAKTFGEHGDLGAEVAVKARWALPAEDEDVVLLSTVDESPESASRPTPSSSRMKSLARAEIQTHCYSPQILPASIYLSRQLDFFSARPIDEYSPLSIVDIEARTSRLLFHHEVEARSASPLVQSFDEPLSTALHSVIESRPISQIPGLPNGYPSRSKWHNAIPIRTVTAGLGESVDRVRREYMRAQQTRTRRRRSEATAAAAASNGLSFEEDAVFASSADADEELSTAIAVAEGEADGYNSSSPSSGMLPRTESSASAASGEAERGGDREGTSDGWGDRWEEEYRRAVEDDGAPEELVLGLMDEEEEERRKWEVRQKALARQWAK